MNDSQHQPTEEPSDAEIEAWLKTPEGQAAMREVLRKVKTGEFGEVPEDLRQMAGEGLKKSHSAEVMEEVRGRLAELMRGMMDLPPDQSRWAHVRGLHEEVKALMDLLLEVDEPHRSKLLRLCLPLQQQLEALLKKY